MDKDVTQIIEGVAAGKTLQALMRKYGDPIFAQAFLYTSEQYATDLTKLTPIPYIPKADASGVQDTPEVIGKEIMSDAGYAFVSGPGNLTGAGKLVATKYTYQAAAGQKVAPYMFPSVWGTGILGAVGIADSEYDFLGLKKHKLLVAAAGSSMLGDGIVRAIGVDGTITAPSGFDVTKQPSMQYLDQSAMNNLKRLTADNTNLRTEIAQLRAASTAQYPRGMPPGIPSYSAQANAQQPVVQVTEIIPGKGAEAIKERTYMVGGAIQKATAESVRHQTGLVTLHGGR